MPKIKEIISPLDEYPIHQTPQPVRRVETPDRNFYDRYYFCMSDHTTNLFAVFGFGVYPNLGVVDAFASIRIGSDYHTVRASRELGVDRADLQVGPFSIEIIEPLKSLRFILAPNEWGLDMDVTWTSVMRPHFATPRFRRDSNERITHDHCRFDQAGRWSGQLHVNGEELIVDPKNWTGTRDRSWGIRPVGDYDAEKSTTRDPGGVPSDSHFWNYAPILFDNYSLIYIVEELRDGTRTIEDAFLYPDDGSEIVYLGKPEHNLKFLPGTRQVVSAEIRFVKPTGEYTTLTVEQLVPMWIFVGTGYRAIDHWRHGRYQGPLAVEGISYSFDNPDHVALMQGTVDSAARFTYEGDVGYGMWEYSVSGPNDRYGFIGPGDTLP